MTYEIVKSRTGLNCVFKDNEDYPVATIEKFSEAIYTVFLLNKKKHISVNFNGSNEQEIISSEEFHRFVSLT